MTVRTEEREIDGTTYVVTQFGAKQSTRVMAQLGRVLGPVLQDVGTLAKGRDQGEFFLALFGRLLSSVTPTELEALDAEFAGHTKIRMTVGNDSRDTALAPVFDTHFAGDAFRSKFVWLAFAIEVNYAAFLPEEIRQAIRNAKTAIAGFGSQRSTGGSGASSPAT